MAAVIAQVSESGGETSFLPEAPVGEPAVEGISPSRSELLVSNYMGLRRSLGGLSGICHYRRGRLAVSEIF